MKKLQHSASKSFRRLMTVPLTAALLLGGVGAAALPGLTQSASAAEQTNFQSRTIQVSIDGKSVSVPGGLSYNQTYVQLTFLSKQLGLNVTWDAKTKVITVGKKGKTLTMKPDNGSYVYVVNGHKLSLGSQQPIILKGTTYLPLRFLLEQMDYKIGYNNAAKLVTIEPAPVNNLTLTNKSYDATVRNTDITIQYPQLSGFANADVQAKVNAALAAAYESYKKDAVNSAQLAYEESTEQPSYPYAYDVNYTITKNDDNLLSVRFEVYTYTGGAHGMYDYQAHNFDLTTGKELTLKEAAQNNANYISIVNNEVKKQFAASNMILLNPFETIQADQRFYLRGDAIVVYFSLYEYTPYAEGMPEFAIPVSKFKS